MVVSQTQIDQADAAIRATWPQNTKYIHPDIFLCDVTIQPNTGLLIPVPCNINVDGTILTSQPVPQSQVWRLDDISTTTTANVGLDALVQFTKNKIKVMAVTAPLTMQVSGPGGNQTRPGLPSVFIYEPQSSLQINAEPTAVDTVTTDTDTFIVSAVIYDSSFG